jgi:carbamoyl-phosphate synthase large subunit
MKKINILTTCAGGTMGYENVLALQAAENVARVIVTDQNPKSIASKYGCPFYVVPNGRDSEYGQVVKDICVKEDIQLIIPGSDEEALALAARSSEFLEKGVTCATPSKDFISVFQDKKAMFDFLAGAGISVPQHMLFNNTDELHECLKIMGYPQRPLLIKPYSGRGGRGVWELREDKYSLKELTSIRELRRINLETLTGIMQETESPVPLMMMEYFPGNVFDVDILASQGEPLCLVGRRRHHWLNIPFYGFTFEYNESVLRLASEVCRALKLTYLYDIDVVIDSQGKAQIVDVNPRLSGSCSAVFAGGINLFDLLVKLVVGEEVPQVEIPYGREIKAVTKAITL